MTRGPVSGRLMALAWPIMLSHLLQTLYNLADAFWLGKLGRQALTAPTITMHVVFIGMALAMGLGAAGTTLVSQYRGAGRDDLAARAGGQVFSLLTLAGILIGITGFILTPQILDVLRTPPDALEMTRDYMLWIFAGVPMLFTFFIYQGISTGLGDSVGPMQVSLISVILNMILDPLLIFGLGPLPAMGVVGAAAATVFCRAVASGLGLFRLLKGRNGFRIGRQDMKPDRGMLTRLLRIGLPIGLGQMGTSLGFTMMIGIVNSFGSAVTAAFGVGNRIIHMAMVPAMGLSQANATAVGQNLGAGRIDRASRSVRSSLFLIGLILVPLTTLMFFFGGTISRIFVNDPAVIELGRTMFRVTTPSVLVFGFLMVIMGSFQGSGHTVPIMVLNLSRLWLLRIPGAYLLAFTFGMGPMGIWWAMFISNTVTTMAGALWFSAGTWKRKVADAEGGQDAVDAVSTGIDQD